MRPVRRSFPRTSIARINYRCLTFPPTSFAFRFSTRFPSLCLVIHARLSYRFSRNVADKLAAPRIAIERNDDEERNALYMFWIDTFSEENIEETT